MLTPRFKELKNQLPPLRDEEIDLYEQHFSLLRSWNEHIGLVSRKSIDHSFANHYVDSLYISEFAKKHWKPGWKAFDLGSGAGFPGFIFAIRYPEIRIVLYEKSLKKQSFLSAVLAQLKLSNVEISGAMAEEKKEGLYLGRAVMPREELFPFMASRMGRNSILITNLGGSTEVSKPPPQFEKLEEVKYSLPDDAGDRKVEALRLVPRGTNS